MTFFIVMFVLLLQYLWRYIDELVGKGLDWKVISELILYATANLVPLALPLSTLLASLMTMGNLGENNELLAMKSAGISFPRILSPLIIITIVISISAFFFSNNVLPYTNLKVSTLLYSVSQQKPELAIKDGVFTPINNVYNIKIGEKNSKTNLMRRIMIYDHSKNEGNIVITYADSGYIKVSDDEKHLIATLYSGNTYEERPEKSSAKRTSNHEYPSTKQKFLEQIITFELDDRGLQKPDDDLFKSSAQAMNLHQLETVRDSLIKQYKSRQESFQTNILSTINHKNTSGRKINSLHKTTYYLSGDSLFNSISYIEKQKILEDAISSARSTKSLITATSDEFFSKGKYIARHKIEWNRKFSLSFACFVFFFIGAPLGAIIRKGGLGMPVVISVLFFVLYYVITITGEKFARELMWQPAAGMWLSSFILLPLGAFLSYKATTDSVIMNSDFYIEVFKKYLVFQKKIQRRIKRIKRSNR